MKAARFLYSSIILFTIALVVVFSILIPNFFYAFAGSVAAVIILVLSIGFTVATYLYIDNHKKRMSDTTYRTLYFIILFVIGFAIRLSCVLSVTLDQQTDFITALGRGIQTLYFSIAGIGFEGQDISVGDYASKLVPAICYFLSMLWLAASYIVVISAGVSYGVYSFFLKFFFCRFGRRSEYYIFTTVSEDAINLADSIRKTKKDKAYIIFASNNLEKFDPSNELHKMIKQRKYPYIILPRRQFMEEDAGPVIGKHFGKIGLISRRRHNSVIVDCGLLTKYKLKNSSFHVFALEMDKEEKGSEGVNSDTIFDDIQGNIYDTRFFKHVIKQYLINDEDNPYFHVDYYVLTHNTINYEFYSKKLRYINKKYEESVQESAQKYKEDNPNLSKSEIAEIDAIIDNVTNEKLSKLFKVNIINEAYLAGISLIKARHEIENERIKQYGDINFVGNEDNDHVAIILGFGQTGQWALKNLYVDTTSVKRGKDEKSTGEQARFIAHVYDEKILNYAGQFEKNHPCFLIANVEDYLSRKIMTFLNENKKITTANAIEFCKLLKEYEEKNQVHFANLESVKHIYTGYDFDEIDKYMKFPHVYFHAKNCNSLSLLNDIDSVVGSMIKAPNAWKKANSIVIALGNDESNIMTANAIIQDIRQELYVSYDKEKEKDNHVDIYVNIRNDKNKHRLNWNTALEKELHPNIHIVTFGNTDEMYSFESIIDNLKVTMLNSNYEIIGDSSDNFDFLKEKGKTHSLAKIEKKYTETKQIIDSIMIIEGFMKCIKRSDFVSYRDELKKAYVELGMLMYHHVSNNFFVRKGFRRSYSKIKEIVTEKSFNNVRAKWALNDMEPSEMKKHLEAFANEMSFDEYVSTIPQFARLGLLLDNSSEEDKKKGITKYLIDLPLFKSFYPHVYKIVGDRKMKEISDNRKTIIKDRNKVENINYEMIFHDISRTLRSFYLDSYSTDSSRYLSSFIGYYDTFLVKKDNNGKPVVPYSNILVDYETRNYLGQLEHARWARYMFSRGSILVPNIDNPTHYTGIMDESPICRNTNYDDKAYSKEFIRIHKDLVPYVIHKEDHDGHYLDDYLEIYDYLNALLAPMVEKEDIEN